MRATYLLILAACIVGTMPLEFRLHTGVYRQWRRLTLALAPVIIVFTVVDVLAIRSGWWHYGRDYLVGLELPGRLPVEELLFFVVVPICTVLTFEAVRARKPAWFAPVRDSA